MQLEQLSLLNYKNFESQSFSFDAKINCFVGQNGVGKTNVLDAIYHLSFGKSYFNPITGQNMRHGTDFFVKTNGNFPRRSAYIYVSEVGLPTPSYFDNNGEAKSEVYLWYS